LIMKKLEFSIEINAPREKVWHILWDDKTYREWTAVFAPGSHARSDWKEGSKIFFLDGKGNGMISLIEKKIGNTEMVFKHLEEVKDGKEHPMQEPGHESYFLAETASGTNLKVELEVPAEYEKYLSDSFPKALQKVKEIAERTN
jgi:hypothetical protein